MTDDNSDDTTVEQLKKRIAELESRVYPNRRDVMAAAVGAVGISALTGTASAAPSYGNASGSVGTQSEPLNDVISKNGTFQSLSTEVLSGAYRYAGSYDGADPDARLDNALSAMSNGDTVFLENGTYTTDRTISSRHNFYGSNYAATSVAGNWTFEAANTYLSDVILDGSLTINGSRCRVERIFGAGSGVTVSADEVVLTQCRALTATFESGTADGVADANTTASITDNGSNVIGDNS